MVRIGQEYLHVNSSVRVLSEQSSPIIRLRRVGKHFGDQQVLQDISLDIFTGEIVALLGASGCGKSTLLNLISGLLSVDNGDILLQGDPLNEFSHWQHLAYLFQEDRLLPWRTVEKNVHFALENRTLTAGQRKKKIADVLQLVGLKGIEQRWPHQLSGGMRSRVALARSLVGEPHILLMDEPFSRLDPQTRSTMHNELLHIQKVRSMTVIIVTHDVEEAVVLADRIVILQPNPGRIKLHSAVSLARPRLPVSREVTEQVRLLRMEV